MITLVSMENAIINNNNYNDMYTDVNGNSET